MIKLKYVKNLAKGKKTCDKIIILHHGIWWFFVASCKLGRMAVSRSEAKAAEFLSADQNTKLLWIPLE